MKKGDLVRLSAYAKRLKNFYVGRDEDIGIIYDVPFFSSYSVLWPDGKKSIHVDRRDLIYAKLE